MKDGDVAGLAAFQRKYGFVGVRMEGNARYIVMVSAGTETPEELQTIPMSGNTVHLKVDCDFKSGPEKAYFYYSIDGKEWTPIGKPLQMVYTLPHFMGYRFGLFQFATKTAGGYVDFDYFRIDNAIEAKD